MRIKSPPCLTARQVCQYLGICRKTLYRLTKRRRLIGYKIHRRWRFKWADVIAYVRIKYIGRVFPAPMLMKYHQAPYKYRVIKKARGLVGHLSLRGEYLKRFSPEKRAREYFKPIKYHRIRLAGGSLIIVVSPRYFDRLPRVEQDYWLRFEMSPEATLKNCYRSASRLWRGSPSAAGGKPKHIREEISR